MHSGTIATVSPWANPGVSHRGALGLIDVSYSLTGARHCWLCSARVSRPASLAQRHASCLKPSGELSPSSKHRTVVPPIEKLRRQQILTILRLPVPLRAPQRCPPTARYLAGYVSCEKPLTHPASGLQNTGSQGRSPLAVSSDGFPSVDNPECTCITREYAFVAAFPQA